MSVRDDTDRYLTVEEVAEMLRVQPTTVRKWLREGAMKGYRIGPRLWRIRESDLERFLQERR